MDTEHPESIHPANAEELANIAAEIGAEALSGKLQRRLATGRPGFERVPGQVP